MPVHQKSFQKKKRTKTKTKQSKTKTKTKQTNKKSKIADIAFAILPISPQNTLAKLSSRV